MTAPAAPRRRGVHRDERRRRVAPIALGLVLVLAAAAAAWVVLDRSASSSRPPAEHAKLAAPPSTAPLSTASPPPVATSAHPARTTSAHADGHQVLTPGGMWWGVDSTGPITKAALANVHDWYRGAHPQFWGRYLNGSYAVTRHELAFARAHGIYVLLLVTDRNCSQCSGVDICNNDRTADQARSDANIALRAARRMKIPRGALLTKDTEQIASCRGEPSPEYLIAWWRTVRPTGYRTGFYGNVHGQDYDFPRNYCEARQRSARFGAEVQLDMNENEPRIGAPRGTTGPHNAPRFHPQVPNCVPRSKADIWQYGESTDPDNYTDIDQARPLTPGMLAPNGTITG